MFYVVRWIVFDDGRYKATTVGLATSIDRAKLIAMDDCEGRLVWREAHGSRRRMFSDLILGPRGCGRYDIAEGGTVRAMLAMGRMILAARSRSARKVDRGVLRLAMWTKRRT